MLNDKIFVRTYERGVEDETLACGTGSVACALITAALNHVKSPVEVKTRGNEILTIYFQKNNDLSFSHVYLEEDWQHIQANILMGFLYEAINRPGL